MAAVTNSAIKSNQNLLLWKKPMTATIQSNFPIFFIKYLELIKYLTEKISITDATFNVIIPGNKLEKLLNDPVYYFHQVRHVGVFYNDMKELEEHQRLFQDKYIKLNFYLEEKLPVLSTIEKTNNALDTVKEIDEKAIKNIASSIKQQVSVKQRKPESNHSTTPKELMSWPRGGYPVKDIEQIDSRLKCADCKLIFRKPYQLCCGHRICQSCVKMENR